MSEAPINLRRVRKARVRAEARLLGDANAAVHGLPKAARDAARIESAAQDRKLDGLRREASQPDGRDADGRDDES